jgi:DNA-binding NtrC family response regulator
MRNSLRYVLLISDDLSTLHALSLAMTMDGYAVSGAMTWSEVMRELQRLPLSAILYDVMELDDEVRGRLQILRRAQPDLPVVLLPSLDSPALSRAVAEGLIAACLVKPLHLTSLQECVQRFGTGRQTTAR